MYFSVLIHFILYFDFHWHLSNSTQNTTVFKMFQITVASFITCVQIYVLGGMKGYNDENFSACS